MSINPGATYDASAGGAIRSSTAVIAALYSMLRTDDEPAVLPIIVFIRGAVIRTSMRSQRVRSFFTAYTQPGMAAIRKTKQIERVENDVAPCGKCWSQDKKCVTNAIDPSAS